MRVALVTGGAVRVGRAMVEALAEDGYAVVVHHHTSVSEAEELVAALRRAGAQAVSLGADLSDAAEVERLAREAAAAFGRIDVLVNNASVFPPEALEQTDGALWDHTLAVNLRAPFLLIRHLAPELRERRGSVVNPGDLAGVQAWAGYAAHAVSKAGLLHLTRVAALALAPDVRVNAIAPGTVLPPESLDGGEVRRLAERAALRRNGSPADVVRALRYLLEGDFVTGTTLTVDGGRLLRG
jgi:pteridine reductase